MKKAIDMLQKIQIAIGGFFLAVFLFTITYQMFTRFASISATWTEDVTMYSFIWAVFMGASAMVHEKAHFSFTSLSDNIKSLKIRKVLAIIIALIMLLFSIFMVYYGLKIARQFWNYTWVNLPQYKRGPTWLCIPIAGATSTIYLLNQIVEDVKSLVKGG
ncbi:MAG TPA: TRAP transporter small permease, partial [Bacteroidales bacterium]|nr:TRAP transporter small permease [Bacteroidales bacterium]